MKKFLAFVLALAMVMALAACGDNAGNDTGGGSDETVTLTLAHIRPVDSPSDVAIRAFAEEATELSGGSIQFEIYPASQPAGRLHRGAGTREHR